MTKLKKKDEYSLPEGCFNCLHQTDTSDDFIIVVNKIICSLTKKEHVWDYGCKKWRIQE
jgi:hypothetical protein